MANMLMFDDVNVALLPSGYTAYAAYVDGFYANINAVRARFPQAMVLSIDVNATNINADCLDIEPGDASNSAAVPWVKAKINAGHKLIVLYTSASNVNALVSLLHASGIGRDQYKLWSAHYGVGTHICGPTTCGLTAWACDGTQFTNRAFGASLDESTLLGTFFGPVTPPPSSDPTLRLGDTGDAVRKLQTRLNAWGFKLIVDGDFGPATLAAVKDFQTQHKLIVDGIVGPATWKALNATPPPPPPPLPYPAPLHLGEDYSRFPLRWDPVVVNGKTISDYDVKVTQIDGKVIASATITGNSTVLSKLVPMQHYVVHVSAVGGPGTPGVASREIIA